MIQSKIKKVTFGADPEVMLINTDTNELVSSIGLIPGQKEEPFALGEDYYLTVDNVLAEFLVPATDNRDDFISVIRQGKQKIKDYLPKNIDIAIIASALYPESELQTEEAKMFGCSSDFNAWTGTINLKPNAEDSRLRSAGGHLHIGYENPTEETSVELVKYLDLFLTVPFVILDPDTRRRELYGKAGAFRLKDYGLEARALSNYWIKNDQMVGFVYDQAMEAINYFNEGGLIAEEDSLLIQECINTSNKDLAWTLLEKYEIPIEIFTKTNSLTI